MNKKNKNKEALKILIVDDNEYLRNSLQFFLQSLSNFIFDIDQAASGEAAVDMVKEKNFGFILMDYSMPPGITGPEAIKRIKKIKPEIKILGVSSFGESCLVEEMINAGANGFLKKNFNGHEILEAINIVRAGGVYYSPGIKEELDTYNSF